MVSPKRRTVCILLLAVPLLAGSLSGASADGGEGNAWDPWEGVPPPQWRVGMSWTYQVTGDFHRVSDYEATFGVILEAPSYFVVGTDSEMQLTNGVVALSDPMTGQVQKDTFRVHEADQYQDLIGFYLAFQNTWNATLWDQTFTMTKGAPQQVEHVGGSSLGRVSTGVTEDGQTLRAAYANDVGWLTELEWRDADGNSLISYSLTGFERDDAVHHMRVWDPIDWAVTRALGQTAPVGAQRFVADGSGDLMLLRARTDAGATGHAEVVSPSLRSYEFRHLDGGDEIQLADVRAGSWTIGIATDRAMLSGGQMTLWTFVVAERGT